MRAHTNPFRAGCIESLAFRWPSGCDPETLLDRWSSLGCRAALIAPKGHGKTTLLATLKPLWSDRGWTIHHDVLREETPRFPRHYRQTVVPAWHDRTLLLLDGSEQLSPWAWWRWKRWSRRAGGVLITRHRPGGLPTLLQLQTSPQLLADLLTELWPGSLADLPAPPDQLWREENGDLRLVFRRLYDWAAGQEEC